ncbi:MAG: hypothetical protein EXQ88_03320 [Alphaproteobacteria bacterium]|nr:hypothetical protein [Alphaproteobacteria bacterium]
MPLTVAIVGSGPSAFYAAEALLETGEVAVDLIERLPTPFGLIRGGVAPDHQHTKRVEKSYTRIAQSAGVRFLGNVEVGRDVALDELRAAYDAVVLATGAPLDRALGIKGEDKRGVYGSAAFVGWYNGHPDFAALAPDLNTTAVVVIGNGNVAIDIARVLVKTPAEMTETDLVDYAARAINASPLTDVYMIGRRGPVEAKFTNVELREMGKLADCAPLVDAADLPATVEGVMPDRDRRVRERNLATLREFAAQEPGARRKRVHFRFFLKPVEILGGARVEGIRLENTRTGGKLDLACGAVIPAIGYRSQPIPGAPFDAARALAPNEDGRVAPGLYAVGWIKRGPLGVIGSNKPDGDIVAKRIRAECPPANRPGPAALDKLLIARGVRVVSFADWLKIDAAERATAAPGAPRRKCTRIADMLAAIEP